MNAKTLNQQIDALTKSNTKDALPLGMALDQIAEDAIRMIARGEVPTPATMAEKAAEWISVLTISCLRLSTELYSLALKSTFADKNNEML